jgi:hypothetical protein
VGSDCLGFSYPMPEPEPGRRIFAAALAANCQRQLRTARFATRFAERFAPTPMMAAARAQQSRQSRQSRVEALGNIEPQR